MPQQRPHTPSTRSSHSRPTAFPRFRPQLESLEDRAVPALFGGVHLPAPLLDPPVSTNLTELIAPPVVQDLAPALQSSETAQPAPLDNLPPLVPTESGSLPVSQAITSLVQEVTQLPVHALEVAPAVEEVLSEAVAPALSLVEQPLRQITELGLTDAVIELPATIIQTIELPVLPGEGFVEPIPVVLALVPEVLQVDTLVQDVLDLQLPAVIEVINQLPVAPLVEALPAVLPALEDALAATVAPLLSALEQPVAELATLRLTDAVLDLPAVVSAALETLAPRLEALIEFVPETVVIPLLQEVSRLTDSPAVEEVIQLTASPLIQEPSPLLAGDVSTALPADPVAAAPPLTLSDSPEALFTGTFASRTAAPALENLPAVEAVPPQADAGVVPLMTLEGMAFWLAEGDGTPQAKAHDPAHGARLASFDSGQMLAPADDAHGTILTITPVPGEVLETVRVLFTPIEAMAIPAPPSQQSSEGGEQILNFQTTSSLMLALTPGESRAVVTPRPALPAEGEAAALRLLEEEDQPPTRSAGNDQLLAEVLLAAPLFLTVRALRSARSERAGGRSKLDVPSLDALFIAAEEKPLRRLRARARGEEASESGPRRGGLSRLLGALGLLGLAHLAGRGQTNRVPVLPFAPLNPE